MDGQLLLGWLVLQVIEWAWLLPVLGTVTAAWTSPAASGTLDLATNDVVTETIWDALVSNLLRIGGTNGFGWLNGVNFANISVNASVASNILTVSILGRDGNALSTSNPALFGFRNAAVNTAALEFVAATSALSIAVPDTALLGTTNGVAYRIWVGVQNNGGTPVVVLFNTQGTNQLYPLPSESALQSATAITTGADSAGVLYGSSATTSKPILWVGYIEITEATAGTWATAPTVVQTMGPGVRRTGDIVQVQRTQTGAVATGTTTMPMDDTIPQSTEGDQYMSLAITPTSAVNILKIRHSGSYSSTAGSVFGIALFQDSTANALVSTIDTGPALSSGNPFEIPVTHHMSAGTTSATTFKIRAGASGAGTTTFNGGGGARLHGGVLSSFLEIVEIFP